jgi:ArsR family transcriptional regulator, arsenate/arsenite/antimonite-responsive transcriptional repressor
MTNGMTLERALLQRFQAVAEETRFGIVQRLAGGERCVCELQGDLEAAQSRLSFHLKKLKDAGVVSDRRIGRWVYYSLVPEALEEMRAFLGEVKPPSRRLSVLRSREPCC